MPAMNATPGSGLSSRCFQLPSGDLARSTTASTRDRQRAIPRGPGGISRISNIPRASTRRHVHRENSRTQQHTACAAPIRSSCPEPLVSTENGLNLHVQPLPPDVDATTRRLYLHAASLSFAAVSSDYWQRRLTGRALCVLTADGDVMCKVSRQTDGGPDKQPAADVSIVLARGHAPLYRAVNSNDPAPECFYRAVAQATQPSFPPLLRAIPDIYRQIIDGPAYALRASTNDWVRSHDISPITRELLSRIGLDWTNGSLQLLNPTAPQHAGITPATPSGVNPKSGWTARGVPLPTDILADASACEAHLRPVMSALAVVSSNYWNQSLGGPSLCVLDVNGRVVCRVSRATDGSETMQKTDALVQMTGDQPQAYSSVLCRTMPNIYQAEPFCSAAAQAAQLLLPPTPNLSTDIYRTLIDHHAANLHASVVEYHKDHPFSLAEAVNHILRNSPVTT